MKKIRTQSETQKPRRKTSFTLLEVIIVTAIISIGAAVVMFVLNPPELLAKARDSQRMSDMAALKTALGVYFTQVSNPDLDGDNSRGTCGTNIWLGRANTTDITDTNVGYLTLHASGDSGNTAITGSGWIPVNFSQITGGSPISTLPLDPGYSVQDVLHVKDTDYFYLYTCNTDKTYELSTNLESTTYSKGGAEDKESTDGGNDPDMYEVGINTSLIKDISATASWVGVGGFVSNGGGTANGVAIDSSGNVYVAGEQATNGTDWFMRKFTPTGALDTSWGSSGVLTYNSGGTQFDYARAIIVDPNKNIFVAGSQGTNSADWAIRKYDATGTLDTSWGSSGMINYNSGGAQTDMAYAITMNTSTGDIYVGGFQGTGGRDWAIRKYTSGGSLDTSWGSSGMVTYNSGGTNTDEIRGIGLDSDNNLYVVGYLATNGGDWAARKYTSTGALDTSWGISGMVTYNSGNTYDIAYSFALDQSKNIYIGGHTGYDDGADIIWTTSMIRKYTAAGVLDTAWGSSGSVSYNDGTFSQTNAIAVDTSNNIYAVTSGDSATTSKYRSNGVLDTSWGSAGRVTGGGANAIGIDSSRNIFVASSSTYKYTSFGALDNQ